jgi:hypothetical protein
MVVVKQSWGWLSGKKLYLLLLLGGLAWLWGALSGDYALWEAVKSSPLWQLAVAAAVGHKIDKASK